MRTMDQKRVLDDVVAWATDDPNVRLLLVTGSFARGEHDDLSDLDIELYVRETDPLLEESAWYERFGRVLVTEALENPDWHPTRLVYYVDGKIDFMVAPVLALAEGVSYDGPYLVLVDKDARANRLEPTVGVAPPSADDFRLCVNWFYAAALQYAKAVARDDPWPVKTRDADLKERLIHMIRVGPRRSDRLGRTTAAQRRSAGGVGRARCRRRGRILLGRLLDGEIGGRPSQRDGALQPHGQQRRGVARLSQRRRGRGRRRSEPHPAPARVGAVSRS
jgi:predicted nucleotidyltransferase